MKRLLYTATLLLMSITFSGCDELFAYEDLLGKWAADYYYDGYNYRPLDGQEVDWFTFYRDHTGRYEYYDRGRLYYSDFDWEVRSGHQLEISFRDRGGRTYERYYYDWDARRNLMLSETSNFSRYTAYRLY